MEVVNLFAIPFRFSQFFVSPLVKAEAMEREVLAVDSGNLKTIASFKMYSILQIICLHTN